MKVFVVVLVYNEGYPRYHNMFASIDKQKCIKFANRQIQEPTDWLMKEMYDRESCRNRLKVHDLQRCTCVEGKFEICDYCLFKNDDEDYIWIQEFDG